MIPIGLLAAMLAWQEPPSRDLMIVASLPNIQIAIDYPDSQGDIVLTMPNARAVVHADGSVSGDTAQGLSNLVRALSKAYPRPQTELLEPLTIYNLPVTTRGCAWRPNEALPDWCGPLMWKQGKGELRQLREHERREIRRIRRR